MSEEASVSIGGAFGRAALRPVSWPLCVTVFFAGNVLLWADRSNFSVAAAAWAKEYDWTPSTIGMMLSAFSLGYLIMQPLGGWLADRIGPRRTFSVSMAGWSLWVLLTPLAPTVLWLTAAFRVLLGVSEAPYISGVVVGGRQSGSVGYAARKVQRLHAIGRAARACGGGVLRRRDFEPYRLCGDDLRRLRRRGFVVCRPVVALRAAICGSGSDGRSGAHGRS